MGSSSSKPRKGHEQPHHLAKVGTPANKAWEHEEHQSAVFGSKTTMIVVLVIGALAVVGLLLLTL